jgi:2,3-diketo-5-methylthio-1-phosphopentane phosphatase
VTQRPYDAVLLDIEGTTTPVSFVYDILFPYARTHVETFLRANWSEPQVMSLLALMRIQADNEAAAETPGVVTIPKGEGALEATVAHVLWQMDADRKTTALKSLQGHIWKAGYASGELLASVFEDVPKAFERWQSAGVPVHIYSSGSIAAQKLLFGHTAHGDLMPLLSGYYDTTSGPKKEAASYAAIAEAIGTKPGRIVFATDIVAEAEAARTAGLQAVIMDRPGNAPQPDHNLKILNNFNNL